MSKGKFLLSKLMIIKKMKGTYLTNVGNLMHKNTSMMIYFFFLLR